MVQPLASAPPPPAYEKVTEADYLKESQAESKKLLDPQSPKCSAQPASVMAVETDRADSVSEPASQEIDNIELPFLPLHVHLPLALLLYFYYTFNPFSYLAGLAAGFLLFYFCLGAVFVAYVQREEEGAETALAGGDRAAGELSPDFMRSMEIRLEDYHTRFTAPSKKDKFEFMATLAYDFATHHRRDRLKCRLNLANDFELRVNIFNSEGDTLMKRTFHLSREKARITVVPDDVFQNRKRRWSKKYPIRVEVGGSEFFLFANVSRFKQEWFFRLREAAKGTTTDKLIKRQKDFFTYIQQYFPSEPLRHSASAPPPPTTSSVSPPRSAVGVSATAPRHGHSQRRHRMEEGAVQFSSSAVTDSEEDIAGGSISISKSSRTPPCHQHGSVTSVSSSLSESSSRPSSGRPTSGGGVASTSRPPPGPCSSESYWINALTARLYWDVWHEERWKKWIVTRIERKLVRIKTPRFLDPLQLTDIEIGDSMPVINRLYEGPFLRVDGVWVFLDVEYEGLFVMTIKTRLKLSRGGRKDEERGTEMKAVKHHSRVSHSQAATMDQRPHGEAVLGCLARGALEEVDCDTNREETSPHQDPSVSGPSPAYRYRNRRLDASDQPTVRGPLPEGGRGVGISGRGVRGAVCDDHQDTAEAEPRREEGRGERDRDEGCEASFQGEPQPGGDHAPGPGTGAGGRL
jgi:hypothetical protein